MPFAAAIADARRKRILIALIQFVITLRII
jgi:hypothetical protein